MSGVGDERLEERLTHAPAMAAPRERPDLVREKAGSDRPRLLQQHRGRARPPLLRAQRALRGRGQQERRAEAPDETAPARRLRWREEEALRRVRQTEAGALARRDPAVPVHDREDRARDEVPVVVELDRDDRLDVQLVDHAVGVPADAVVGVLLEGYADQRRDRIVELLGQLFLLVRARDRGEEARDTEKRQSEASNAESPSSEVRACGAAYRGRSGKSSPTARIRASALPRAITPSRSR